MKKIQFIPSIIFIIILLTSPLSGTELKFNTQNFKLFSYEKDGIVRGPASDIIRAVCKKMNIKCSFKLLPWPRAQHEVKIGEANGMFVIGWNKERDKRLYFTSPIITTEYVFFVRKENNMDFKNVMDVKGYSVGVYGPSNTAKSLEIIKNQIKNLEIFMTTNDEPCFLPFSRKVGSGLFK